MGLSRYPARMKTITNALRNLLSALRFARQVIRYILLRCHDNFVRPHRGLKFGREVRTPTGARGRRRRDDERSRMPGVAVMSRPASRLWQEANKSVSLVVSR